MYCKNCGAEINEGALFCGNCGMKIETEQPVYEAPAEPVFEEPVQEEPVQGEYHQDTHNEYQEQGSYVPPVMPENPPVSETVVPAEKPNTVLWIVLSAVEIFTCCGLTGIVSLIYAILGHLAADKGDFADAAKKIKTAKIWFWVGIGLGILATVICVVCVAVFGFAAGVTDEILSGYYY
ncbi:MAG: CD225/dispanin family protein [Oscillospiraceae bacterium]|nr:CD225/dispanin family protein [Oscillospiraceae bacterium]